jgi:hypothetical protein
LALNSAIQAKCRTSRIWTNIRVCGIFLTKSNLAGIAMLQPQHLDFSWSSMNDEQVLVITMLKKDNIILFAPLNSIDKKLSCSFGGFYLRVSLSNR